MAEGNVEVRLGLPSVFDDVALAASNAAGSMLAMSDVNFAKLRELMESVERRLGDGPKPELLPNGFGLYSVPIVTSSYLASTTRKWVPPKDPFVEFEASDEAWAKKLGFGTFEERPVAYGLGGLPSRMFTDPFRPRHR